MTEEAREAALAASWKSAVAKERWYRRAQGGSMSGETERETPFDYPTTLLERVIFPMLRAAYRDGLEQGSRDTIDALRETNIGRD